MIQGRKYVFQVFPAGLGASGKIYYESHLSYAGGSPGEHGPWRDGKRILPDCFGYARCFPVTNLFRSLGSHIPQGKAGTSRGKYDIYLSLICQAAKLVLKGLYSVRKQQCLKDIVSFFLKYICNKRAAFILAFALCAPVA